MTWARGITRTWPSTTGLSGRMSTLCGVAASMFAGAVPAMMSQNTHPICDTPGRGVSIGSEVPSFRSSIP